MWNCETIFSGGELAGAEKWIEYMHKTNKIFDEESATEAIEERKYHVKACIARLADELEQIDRLGQQLIEELPEREESED